MAPGGAEDEASTVAVNKVAAKVAEPCDADAAADAREPDAAERRRQPGGGEGAAVRPLCGRGVAVRAPAALAAFAAYREDAG